MSRGVRSGRLKDSLGIQTGTESSGEYGGTEYSWSTDKFRRCEIRPLRAVEFYRAGGENVENLYEIRFRYEPGLISTSKRLIDTRVSPNRVFDIEGIVDTGNWNREIVVTAVERQWPLRG